MIDIKIGGNSYQLPDCNEINIGKFCDYLEFCDQHQPDEESKDPKVWLSFYAHHIAYWTGANIKEVRRCKADDIAGVYGLHQQYLVPQEDYTYNCFKLNEDLFYLPAKLMQKSTIEDYAEADEYQKQLSDLLNGHYKALPKIAAVLCRKEGEGFDDYNVEDRAKLFEDQLSVYDCFQIGFFLQRLNEKLQTDLQIYMTSLTLSQLKQALKN